MGINAATLYDWQCRFPKFSEGLEKADATCERVCIGPHLQSWAQLTQLDCKRVAFGEEISPTLRKVDRHVIRTQHEGAMLPPDYLQAVNRALGVSGEFKPLIMSDAAGLLRESKGTARQRTA